MMEITVSVTDFQKGNSYMNVLDMFKLDGQTAIVTGGAGRYGKQIVEALAEAGATVFIASRNLEACQTVADNFVAKNLDVRALQLDLNKEESIDLDFMRGYRVDRGENPNSYFQTDAELCPETILLQVEDVFAQEIIAADDPADSRGCLSWHYQPQVRKNEEAGSYGFVCEAVIPAQTADTLPASFKISLKGQKGFSVYGRSSGRYPIGFEISAK